MYFLSLGETKEKLRDGGSPKLKFHERETTDSHFSSHPMVGVWELNSISQSWAETPAIQHNKTQWHIRQEEMPRTAPRNAAGETEKLNYSTLNKNICVDI